MAPMLYPPVVGRPTVLGRVESGVSLKCQIWSPRCKVVVGLDVGSRFGEATVPYWMVVDHSEVVTGSSGRPDGFESRPGAGVCRLLHRCEL